MWELDALTSARKENGQGTKKEKKHYHSLSYISNALLALFLYLYPHPSSPPFHPHLLYNHHPQQSPHISPCVVQSNHRLVSWLPGVSQETRVLDLTGPEKDSYRHRWSVQRRDLEFGVELLKVELRMSGRLKAKEGLVGGDGRRFFYELARGFEDLVVRERTSRRVSKYESKLKIKNEHWGVGPLADDLRFFAIV